jgi:predicted nucleotidyltransferase
MKKRVAREAAVLMYSLHEKEYKQAKKRAAQTLGVRILPSNIEVAKEIDMIADEVEGSSRQKRLLQMRKDALWIMTVVQDFYPKLVGSVWRGTAHRNSDIDISVFSESPNTVLTALQKNNFRIEKSEWCSVTKRGKAETSFHIHFTLPSKNEVEIVVRSLENRDQLPRCEIYGDLITGLNHSQLQKILKINPLIRFTPNH